MKKIVYADFSKAPSREFLEQMRDDVIRHIAPQVKTMALQGVDGRRVLIDVKLDITNPHQPKFFNNARASRTGAHEYEVYLGGGLLARLDLVARTLTADRSLLRGSTRTQLLDPRARADGRAQVIKSFAFFFLVDFVFWHEVAHIVLGHVDWLAAQGQGSSLAELFAAPATAAEAQAIRFLEADADRQSVIWTANTFDLSLQRNPYLRYASLADAFHDFGLLSVALFGMLDAFDDRVADELRTHPENHQRMMVMLSYVSEYLDKHRPDARAVLAKACSDGGGQALETILHVNRRMVDPMEVIGFLGQFEAAISDQGVRQLQLRADPAGETSFNLPWVDDL